jgi:flagellar hook protein FlgE
MAFNTALSGLRAANWDLSVTGNNIANASTTGFKRSRAEFADVYANSILGSGSRAPGSGVLVSDIAQQFDQGNISITNNSLDLAISGQGFFILSDQGTRVYTRSGIFGLDNSGYVVSNTGARLQGFGADINGDIISGALTDLRIQTSDIAPNATTQVNLTFNLDSGSAVPGTAVFSPTDPTSYNWSTAATIYDSLGNPHVLTTYYVKNTPTPTGTDWDVYSTLDGGTAFNSLGTLSFNTGGALIAPSPASLSDTWPAPGGAAPLVFNLNLAGSTQFGAEFSVNSLTQNGYAPGRLSGINIDDTGVIFARYTNGQALTLGQVALANFANPQGLSPIGNTQWAESFDSGQPVIGAPQTASLGSIQSGALEDSNVDLSEQLVNLIIAQRNFQANAKTIETSDAVTQAIINLR